MNDRNDKHFHEQPGEVNVRPTTITAITLLVFSVAISPASALTFCKEGKDRDCFTGKFGLADIPGDPKHKLLEADFGYVDPRGIGWQTNKGAETDGASVPPLLQPYVGSPWEDGYIRAAVIHDWYCDRHVRAWQETHKVFYDAMIASGLDTAKAKLLFYAVYAFGPSWGGYLDPGTPCSGTQNCIQTVGQSPAFVIIPAKYDDVSKVPELKAMETVIEMSEPTGGFTIDQLIAIADKAHPRQPLLDKVPSKGEVK